MDRVQFSEAWHRTFSGGHVGLLLLGPVDNRLRPSALDKWKEALPAALQQRYGGMTRAELQELAVLGAYKAYYRQFNKSYHVQLQLESVVHKGKSLPSVSPLVDACFAAEMETQLLTASHDAARLAAPVVVDASTGEEMLAMMNGKEKQIKGGDMMMRDGGGVICTILYGQDRRTAVTAETEQVLYVTYAPPGVSREAVAGHHETILGNVRLFAPAVNVEYEEIVRATG